MAITYIARQTDTLTQPITAATTVAASTPFSLNSAGGGMLLCTAVSAGSPQVIKFNVSTSASPASTYELRDATNTAISLTVDALKAYDLPAELFAAPYIFITIASGTATFLISTKS